MDVLSNLTETLIVLLGQIKFWSFAEKLSNWNVKNKMYLLNCSHCSAKRQPDSFGMLWYWVPQKGWFDKQYHTKLFLPLRFKQFWYFQMCLNTLLFAIYFNRFWFYRSVKPSGLSKQPRFLRLSFISSYHSIPSVTLQTIFIFQRGAEHEILRHLLVKNRREEITEVRTVRRSSMIFSEHKNVTDFLIGTSEITRIMRIASRSDGGVLIIHSKMYCYAPI